MPKVHEVAPGECVFSICAHYGILDWKRVYDHPDNKELKASRPDPHYLEAGDRVVIPDPRPKTVQASTGKTHRFVAKRPYVWLRLKVFDHVEGDKSPGDYALEVDGLSKPITGAIKGDGSIEAKIPPAARKARLTIKKGEDVLDTFALDIGALPPFDTIAGVQERLNMLGFDCGETDGTLGPRTERAITLFRQRFAIEESEMPGAATEAKLKELVGW